MYNTRRYFLGFLASFATGCATEQPGYVAKDDCLVPSREYINGVGNGEIGYRKIEKGTKLVPGQERTAKFRGDTQTANTYYDVGNGVLYINMPGVDNPNPCSAVSRR